jgi:two-component system, NarL family, nitrate/nitrite response regulator NarL
VRCDGDESTRECARRRETVASHSAASLCVNDPTTIVPRALIVDDNEQFLASARKVLAIGGIEVAGTATSGKEAVRLASELRPDVALVDIDLGGENGFDVAVSLAALDVAPVVVLISTHAAEEVEELVASSVAAGFVPKARLDADAIRGFLP